MPDEVRQCRTCPWRVDCVPHRDIPGYCRALHEQLADTIRSGLASMAEPLRVMLCHYSPFGGPDVPCAGWLAHQLGPGQNFGVRVAVAEGRLPRPHVEGPQHETFAATLAAAGEADTCTR
jgi:hypothetical protein